MGLHGLQDGLKIPSRPFCRAGGRYPVCPPTRPGSSNFEPGVAWEGLWEPGGGRKMGRKALPEIERGGRKGEGEGRDPEGEGPGSPKGVLLLRSKDNVVPTPPPPPPPGRCFPAFPTAAYPKVPAALPRRVPMNPSPYAAAEQNL